MFLMYLRKSRADGEHETVEEVLAKHYKILQDYAAAKLGGAVPEDRIYREVVSGETIQDRPQMLRLLERIQSESIEGVLVVDPQRLSRGNLSDCGRLIDDFRYTDTKVVTPMMIFDLSNKMERRYFQDDLLRGADFLDYIKGVLQAGREAAVRRGCFIMQNAPYGFDKVKIGKLNYHPSDIDWADFGRKAEEICKLRGIHYYIKDSLRAEMEKGKQA